MYQLTFEKRVDIDISDAYVWYEEQSIGVGEQFLNELNLVLEKIKNHPQIFSSVTKYARQALVSHFPYVIVFKIVSPNKVVVLSVFHTSRNSNKKFRS